MYYGNLKKCDIANGIGVRVTLFVSGCTNHCPDCFQPQTWDFHYGKPFTDDTRAEIFAELDKPYVNVLVDGRFVAAEKDISLQFRGSRNQRVLDLPKTLAAGQPVIWEHLKK